MKQLFIVIQILFVGVGFYNQTSANEVVLRQKSDVSTNFLYNTAGKPYAISHVEPTTPNAVIPMRTQSVSYTSFERPSNISENNYTASFTYNAVGERVKMQLLNGSRNYLTRYYLGGSQYEIDAGTLGSKEKLYLGGNAYTAPAVYFKQNGAWSIHYICRDYLGSITHVTNANGSLVEELSYDAWGRRRNPANQAVYAPDAEPTTLLGRGYTGHELLPWFGLINMNARLYDPAIGRFLSPDPFVQSPDFSQNFNRYSYALNNPLVFTDPDGEIAWFVPVIIGAVIGAYSGGVIANNGQYNPTKWDYNSGKTWGYMAGGALVGGASAGFGASIAASGGFMANTMGIMGSSFVNSIGMNIVTGGQTPTSISFGVASYDLTNNSWGYLGKKGNKWYQNLGYGLGALANLADLGEADDLLLNTEKKDIINHSAILDKKGNTIISEGPGKNWIEPKGTVDHYLNRFLGGSGATNEYPVHGDNMTIKNVNVTTINNYGKVLNLLTQRGNGVVPYSFLYSSCSTHTGLALNLAGIPTLFLHPYTVQASVWLWNTGITPALINNSYYLQNYR